MNHIVWPIFTDITLVRRLANKMMNHDICIHAQYITRLNIKDRYLSFRVVRRSLVRWLRVSHGELPHQASSYIENLKTTSHCFSGISQIRKSAQRIERWPSITPRELSVPTNKKNIHVWWKRCEREELLFLSMQTAKDAFRRRLCWSSRTMKLGTVSSDILGSFWIFRKEWKGELWSFLRLYTTRFINERSWARNWWNCASSMHGM